MTSPAVAAFHALHQSGCFVIPNPWDVGSAALLHHLGFRALASSSAGYAFTVGKPDSTSAIALDPLLAHLRDLVGATPLPVHADFQSGYARDAEGIAANVTACVATGVAGLSIEDATGDAAAPLYDLAVAVERLRAARRAIDAGDSGVSLTARCEAWLVGAADPARTAIDRLVAFADAGADVLFAPGVKDPDTIAVLVRAVAPKPLNVIVSAAGTGLSVKRIADLGVRRISVGSALARAAWGEFLRAARLLASEGSFEGLAGAASFAELNQVFGARAPLKP